MLTTVLAHTGQPPAPHDIWREWNTDPLVLSALLVVWLAYARGRRRDADDVRARWFQGAMAALVVALVSPLDALADALASAHMVQHVLLVLVAAPLLALSAPASALLRGAPLVVRRTAGRWRRRMRPIDRSVRPLTGPVAVWLLHVVVLWFWHAAGPYDAALRIEILHVLEHATFLVTGVLFWRVVIGARGGSTRVSPGFGILLVFTMAMQSVLLSVLLTFARTPWYGSYATTTTAWGLDQLADQQLAGAIMWIPAGLVYLGVAVGLLVSWLRRIDQDMPPVAPDTSTCREA